MTPYLDRRSPQICWPRYFASLKMIGSSVVKQLYGFLSRSWMNALLLCVPAGIALNYLSGSVIAVLVVNFLATIGLLGLGDAIFISILSRIGTRYGMLLYISARYVSARSRTSVTLT